MTSDGFVINNDMRRSSHSNSSCGICAVQMLRVLKDFERLEVYDHCERNNMMFSVALWFHDLMIILSAPATCATHPKQPLRKVSC